MGREVVGEDDEGRPASAVELGGGGLPVGDAARHDHEGVRGRERVLHDEGPADQAERGLESSHRQDHQRRHREAGDGEPETRAPRHRSSSTKYSLILRASGASGLRARYFRKASFDFSGCLLW